MESKKSIIIGVLAGALAIVILVLVLVFTGVINLNSADSGEKTVTEQTEVALDATPTIEPTETPEPTATPEPTLSPEEVKYQEANEALSNKKYSDAATTFKELGDYEDSKELYKKSRYLLANSYYKKGKYEKAQKVYKQLKNYKKSKSKYNKCVIKLFQKRKVNIYNWEELPSDPYLDGISVRVSWDSVKSASGYQIYEGEKEGDWYFTTHNTKSRSYTTSFSSVEMLQARVRAYKVVAGKKYYTDWSSTVEWYSEW